MNKVVKIIVAAVLTAGYYVVLRYVAPCREPYFLLGLGLIGYVAWLYGVAAGLALALFLTPLTLYIYNGFEVAISFDRFAYSPVYIAVQILVASSLGWLRNRIQQLSRKESDLMDANENLQAALSQVREMGGIHSLCTTCKSILDDDGSWTKIDSYLIEKTKAEFSHGICPECAKKFDIPAK